MRFLHWLHRTLMTGGALFRVALIAALMLPATANVLLGCTRIVMCHGWEAPEGCHSGYMLAQQHGIEVIHLRPEGGV